MNLIFYWPWAFVLLPLPLMWRWIKPRPQMTSGGPFVPVDIAATLRDTRSSAAWPTRVRQLLMWCAWISLVTALAQPQMPMGLSVQAFSGRDVMLVVDLSGSMEKKDFTFDESQVTRLNVVKHVASDFVKQRDGDRLGLILFADEAFVASPLTFDLHSIRHYIGEAQIGLAGRSTALGDAIGLGLRRLNDSTSQHRVMVLLTDGSNNAGDVEPDSAAQLANQLGIRIHTIALGAEAMTIQQFGEDKVVNPSLDLDVDALERIANTSGGSFFRARSTQELQAIYRDIDQLERSEHTSPPFVPQRDLRIVPLLLSFVAMLGLGIIHGRASSVRFRQRQTHAMQTPR